MDVCMKRWDESYVHVQYHPPCLVEFVLKESVLELEIRLYSLAPPYTNTQQKRVSM